MLARGWAQARAVVERQEGKPVFQYIITFVGWSTKREEMQSRVAAPQRLPGYAVSEVCTRLESLCSPWTALNTKQK